MVDETEGIPVEVAVNLFAGGGDDESDEGTEREEGGNNSELNVLAENGVGVLVPSAKICNDPARRLREEKNVLAWAPGVSREISNVKHEGLISKGPSFSFPSSRYEPRGTTHSPQSESAVQGTQPGPALSGTVESGLLVE